VCPVQREYCPSSQEDVEVWLDTVDEWQNKTYSWDQSIMLPDVEAEDWHCKYRVVAEDEL
jgi:hypothetical protein